MSGSEQACESDVRQPAEVGAFAKMMITAIEAASQGDPLARYRMLTGDCSFYQGVISLMSDDRAVAVAEMSEAGMSYSDIRRETGLSKARISQLAARGRTLREQASDRETR